MKIFSFYVNVPDLNMENELRLSFLWRARWKKQGFDPIILNEWTASKNPFYAEFKAAIGQLPTINPKRYEEACFLRWLALAQVGGGWLMDLDVMPNPANAGLCPMPTLLSGLESDKLRIFQKPCCPAVSYAKPAVALKFCEVAAKKGLELGNRPQSNQPHVSDQYVLEGLLQIGVDWIEVHDIVRQFGDGHEAAPIIHFPNAVMAGRQPRYKTIPQIIPEAQ